MDWLRHHMRDHLSNVRPFPASERATYTGIGGNLPSAPRTEAFELIEAAADLIKGIEDQSAAVETRARALADRASDELKASRNRIEALEFDCNKLIAFAAESKDRALTAEQSLQEAQTRIAVLEAQVAAAERRAGEAEQMLVRVEDAIRSEILQPHSRKVMAAA
jgi:DNA repair exonuclease SbcCD ATPase subunit